MSEQINSLLKFITCGSVDDGKSTLIGHMLFDAKLLFADQAQALELDSRIGSREGKIDYSLLLDGLMAEREQGITIDVAYRYFTTEKRSFIVADTPGHEEYTRNMAVGASFADLAVILVDASQGVLVQTRRHSRICALMGIKHVVFAVNKMDLIGYDKYEFQKIKRDIDILTAEFCFRSKTVIPVSATEGDNITKKSGNMPWYEGRTLLDYLETIDVRETNSLKGFVMPVQRVSRPSHEFRGFQGQVEEGDIHVGDRITALPSGETADVKSILVAGAEKEQATKGQAVTITLDREVDISRGCVLVRDRELQVTNMFTAKLLWMDDGTLLSGKNYFLKVGTASIPATVMRIKHKIDVNTGEPQVTDKICKNEIAECDVWVSDKITVDEFRRTKSLGALILIDRVTNMTSACGIIEHTIRRADNLTWHEMDVTRSLRAQMKGQKPVTIWFTGLSGSGKSTLANEVEKRLTAAGRHTMLLDGDNIRLGLNKNLGFKEEDRIENIRRIAEVARLMNDAGLIVLTSFISPYIRDRENAREIICGAAGDGSNVSDRAFIEVYVNTPMEVCEERDVKGLYKKARSGELSNFTGISSPYEPPLRPEITISTDGSGIADCADRLMEELKAYLSL